jgi:hypothetical protein
MPDLGFISPQAARMALAATVAALEHDIRSYERRIGVGAMKG